MESTQPKSTNKNPAKADCSIQMGDGTSSQGSSTDDSIHHHQDTLKDKRALYKTEICRNYEELHTCRYGFKCRYAHGKQELRSVQRHPRYKTIFCRTYEATGECPYGIRCTFLHPSPPKISLPPSPPLAPAKKPISIHPPPAQPALKSPFTKLPASPPMLAPPGFDSRATSVSAPMLCSSFARPPYYDDGEQQRLKAAFYSQENHTPMTAKHRLSGSGFTEYDRCHPIGWPMAYYVDQ
ncbi:hypothetical protein [Absidia glauca]|uniref:C3H1-type domain-containing protein n=1 Tax=Absidia glauca TaxID=4829 RepID=A0A168N581_ABSGL|nr:hypothetical protein [Absidia glauca]